MFRVLILLLIILCFYRCRSAFKLLEIDDKYGILKPGNVVIDCGCAPGSWSQVALQKVNSSKGLVIGVDLLQMYPLEGAHLLGNTDFTTENGQQKIRDLMGKRKANVVLSDMAPNATGINDLDYENITMLCYTVLRFAIKMSQIDGSLLMKIWMNPQINEIEKQMKRFYKNVKIIKPKASRSDSAEQYLLGRNFVGLEEEEENKKS